MLPMSRQLVCGFYGSFSEWALKSCKRYLGKSYGIFLLSQLKFTQQKRRQG